MCHGCGALSAGSEEGQKVMEEGGCLVLVAWPLWVPASLAKGTGPAGLKHMLFSWVSDFPCVHCGVPSAC